MNLKEIKIATRILKPYTTKTQTSKFGGGHSLTAYFKQDGQQTFLGLQAVRRSLKRLTTV